MEPGFPARAGCSPVIVLSKPEPSAYIDELGHDERGKWVLLRSYYIIVVKNHLLSFDTAPQTHCCHDDEETPIYCLLCLEPLPQNQQSFFLTALNVGCGIPETCEHAHSFNIDNAFSEEMFASVFIVCVISTLKIVAAVTAYKPQHKYILCLMLWPEFPLGSLAQNSVQKCVPEHLEIKFRAINVYAKNICPVP